MREKLLSSTEHKRPVIDCVLSEDGRRQYSTFIDTGANVGTISWAVSHHFKSCIAMEPSAADFSRLNQVMSRLPNYLAIYCALGNKRGSTCVYLSGTGQGDDTVFRRRDLVRWVKVRIETLDYMLGNMGMSGPFLIKIDVQGYEPFVMKGAKEAMREKPPVVSDI